MYHYGYKPFKPYPFDEGNSIMAQSNRAETLRRLNELPSVKAQVGLSFIMLDITKTIILISNDAPQEVFYCVAQIRAELNCFPVLDEEDYEERVIAAAKARWDEMSEDERSVFVDIYPLNPDASDLQFDDAEAYYRLAGEI